jgi:hypothetical protein
MGISIAVCEVDSDAALCKMSKNSFVKVYLGNVQGYERYSEYDTIIPVARAKEVLGAEWEAFAKRNRIDAKADIIYLEKVKNEADRAKLARDATKNPTGWVLLNGVAPDKAREIISKSSPDDRLTGWDMVSFEEMGETCKKCDLSWDEGRGCVGTFGPENSLLPEIAAKYGASIIANVPISVKTKKTFMPEDAKRLLDEVKVLREKLPLEGKQMVHRYSGVLDRLEKVANLAIKYNTKFYFI